jgi:hypothetical protein
VSYGTVLRQKYSVSGGPDETKSKVKFPMHALSRVSPEELMVQKMRELSKERAVTRMNQKFLGGLYAE